MSQTEEDVIVLNVSTDTSGKTIVVKEQTAKNVIVVSPEAASIPAGPQGPQGPQGPPGADGAQGPPGVDGQDGADGTSVTILGALDSPDDLPSSGSNGDGYIINGDLYVWDGTQWNNVGAIQGPQGPQGEPGDTGPQGEIGPAGPQGPKGDTGPQGEIGPAGADGPKGDTGPQGEIGPAGADGPKGDTGDQGPQGIEGPQGPTGNTGDSAYLSWLALGNDGTPEDFINSLKGETGDQGPQGETGPQGEPGETETLDSDIVVFVPNANGQYIFGKYQHGERISFDDPSGNSLNKTAIDIIRDALTQLGTIAQPSITLGPSSVGFNSQAVSGTATITTSVTNVNQSQGSGIIFRLYRRIGTGAYTLIDTSQPQVNSTTASYTFTDSYSFDFPNLTDTPVSSWIYWYVTAEDDQTSQVTQSTTKSYTPSYQTPRIVKVNNNNNGDDGIDIKRVKNAEGSGEGDLDRQIYNGESYIRFEVQRMTDDVQPTKYAVIDNDGNLIGSVGDIPTITNSDNKSSTIQIFKDEGDVAIGDSFTYSVKIWDERRTYNGDYTVTGTEICDVQNEKYDVNGVPVRMVFCSKEIDETASNAEFQDMYNGEYTNSGVQKYTEYITSTGDLLPQNTEQLNLLMQVPQTQQLGDFVYIFVPSYYFSDGSGGYQDLTGGGNLNQDLIQDYYGSAQVQRIEIPPEPNTDYWQLAEAEDLQVQFGTASNKIPFHIFRIKSSLSLITLRGTYYLIRNIEA